MDIISIVLVLASIIAANGENARQPVHSHSTAEDDTKDERVMMGYSDSWVVEVEGGRDEADKLADEHGFVNLGQVSTN